jgi:hypothetical protein
MIDACDCYVSLHRSEGFGLTVAEAMALGKPVISTAYSATTEFTNDANSFLVPANIVSIGDEAPPYPSASHWAEPDVAAAAAQMKRVYADREHAAAIGARARADIETLHGPAAGGALIRGLLDEHRGTPRTAVVDTHTETSMNENGRFEADALAVEAMLGSPRPDLPSPMQRLMTPLRRFILRCIRVYWVQQLGIDRALLAALRTLRRESHHDATRLHDEVARLTSEVRELRRRIDSRDSLRLLSDGDGSAPQPARQPDDHRGSAGEQQHGSERKPHPSSRVVQFDSE